MTLNEAISELRTAGVDSPEHDARAIFALVGGFKSYELVNRGISLDDEAVRPAIERRKNREPLQYIIGKADFYRESYIVNPDCLIPREDTEILVDFAVKNLPDGASFIDLCTGSGCIAVSSLKNTVGTRALAVDISEAALNVAKRNAELNGVLDRIEFIQADAKSFSADGKFFAILSNPPYVTEKEYEALAPELYREPKIAFLGGADGLDFYKSIIKNLRSLLCRDGFFAFEIGKDQADGITEIASANGMSAEIISDYSRNPRVAVLRFKQAFK